PPVADCSRLRCDPYPAPSLRVGAHSAVTPRSYAGKRRGALPASRGTHPVAGPRWVRAAPSLGEHGRRRWATLRSAVERGEQRAVHLGDGVRHRRPVAGLPGAVLVQRRVGLVAHRACGLLQAAVQGVRPLDGREVEVAVVDGNAARPDDVLGRGLRGAEQARYGGEGQGPERVTLDRLEDLHCGSPGWVV